MPVADHGLFSDVPGGMGMNSTRGPAHRFTDAHLLFILHLCSKKRMGRQALASETGLSEGCMRTALRLLRCTGLIAIRRNGTVLTSEGTEYVNRLGISMPDAKPSGIAEGGCNAVLLAHGKGYLMTDCLGVRDAAMRADARGCIPFIKEDGRITSPYYDAVGVEYPDLTGLAEEIDMEDGDAAVVCGADTLPEAYVAAFASMFKLLKPLMHNL